MAEIKLSKACVTALDAMKANGILKPELQWRWTDMRYLLFTIVMQVLGPEMGFDYRNPDNREEVQAAWKAWQEAIDEGFMVESSNGGAKFAKKGYCASKPEAAKAASEFKV